MTNPLLVLRITGRLREMEANSIAPSHPDRALLWDCLWELAGDACVAAARAYLAEQALSIPEVERTPVDGVSSVETSIDCVPFCNRMATCVNQQPCITPLTCASMGCIQRDPH